MADGIYTLSQYTNLGVNAPWIGPFELENRSARDKGGGGNYYSTRGKYTNNILGICVHVTAGITDLTPPDTSAESTNNYGRTTTVQASWTGLVDSDSIINSLHPDRTAWTQGVSGYNFNQPLMGVEIGKRTSDWRNHPQTWVDATLRNLAAYCAPYVVKYKIPLRVIWDRDEVQRLINAGQKVGFTEHYILAGTRSRTDAGFVSGIGSTFPWDRFFMFLRTRISQLSSPAPAPTPPPTNKSIVKGTVLQVTADRLNTRSGPGTNHPVVGGADKGVKIKATGKISGAWVEAQTDWQAKRGVKTWWNSGWLKVVSQPKAPTPPTSTTPKVYTIKAGDTLGEISTRYRTSIRALQFLNGIADANRIEVGQKIYIGWVVASGQTLGGIAEAYGTTVSKLVSLNGIKDPNKIEVGQVIRLP